jgi:hypothetical protein
MTQESRPKLTVSSRGKWIQNLVRFSGIVVIGLAIAVNHADNAISGSLSEETIKPSHFPEFILAYLLSFMFPAIFYALIGNFSIFRYVFVLFFPFFGTILFSVLGRKLLSLGPGSFNEAASDYSRFYGNYESGLGQIFVISPLSFLVLFILELILNLTKPFLEQETQVTSPGEPT